MSTAGLTSGLEVHFPELFGGYEDVGADVVLFSTAGPGDARHAQVFADEARAHASVHQVWIGFAAPAVTASAVSSTSWTGRPGSRWTGPVHSWAVFS